MNEVDNAASKTAGRWPMKTSSADSVLPQILLSQRIKSIGFVKLVERGR